MRVCISRKPISGPWGGGNLFVKGMSTLLKNKGHQVFYDLVENLDYILMIDPRPSNYGIDANQIFNYKYRNPKTRVLHRINECDKRKGSVGLDKLLLTCANLSDDVVFISEWVKNYFTNQGYDRKSTVIYNGCNVKDFTYKKSSEINSVHLVTHHWSDNILKGYDFYKKIDDVCLENNWQFTFIGRFNKNIKTNNTQLIEPKTGKELAEKIKLGNIYVTASKWEPCGMHHIEAASCGIPVLYHENGGGINEGCQRYGEKFSNLDTFKIGLEKIVNNYSHYRNEILNYDLSIEACCLKYLSIMERNVNEI